MEGEINNFIKVWILAMISLCYSYYIAAKIPRGFLRLLSLLPVISLFLYLPMTLSFFSLCGTTSIFLSWYANSKLLLFSFDHGPLSPPPRKLLHFISIASLPIKIKQYPHRKSQEKPKTSFLGTISLVIKGVLTIILFKAHNYREYLHRNFMNTILLFHFEFGLECIYAVYEIPPKYFLGFDLEPQFNKPLLATSLQDFWGRRWNLMSSDILRQTIYNPLRRISTHIIGHRWASLLAVLVTFLVSGLMHEVIYYHLAHLRPTWEATLFLVMQGILVDVEIVMKKKRIMGNWQLITVISRPLVLGFRVVTSIWLLFAPLLRNGMSEKAFMEYSMAVDFVMGFLPY